MSLLTIWPDSDPQTVVLQTQDPELIATTLAAVGVEFDRWEIEEIPIEASADDVLAAYSAPVAAYSAERGFIMVDAVAMARRGTDEEWATLVHGARNKFLSEHTHDDDEIRFFARGAGVFYLRINDKVHALLCTAGDLISVPRDTRHWFDMGSDPDFAAIRFFREDDGWIGNFTGDEIARNFPDFDELATTALSAVQ